MMNYTEVLHPHYGQVFEVERIIYRERTEHQDLIIFENQVFGRVLALDGAIQTTERDNHIYHEMLVHVPMLAHGQARRVLIIGGGDGGSLREAVKHPDVAVTMVEIDASVIELSRTHLPRLSDGAFDHPNASIEIADGCKFVAETDQRFDVIVVDSTDPIGPGAVLFTQAFYADCRRCLADGGVLVTQNGVPLLQMDELVSGHRRLGEVFADVSFYFAPVPTYTGGAMALGWATDNPALRKTAVDVVAERMTAVGLATEYYTPAIHAGAFAMPRAIADALDLPF